jgi:hypothetical protein
VALDNAQVTEFLIGFNIILSDDVDLSDITESIVLYVQEMNGVESVIHTRVTEIIND